LSCLSTFALPLRLALLLCLVLAAPGAAAARDLSGIWEVKVTGTIEGSTLLCRVVPPFNHTQLDTVARAGSLEELFHALVPPSSRDWLDSVCDPVFYGPGGDSLRGTCQIPLTYAKPCRLVADVEFRGRLTSADRFAGQGGGDVELGGPGMCPASACPGTIQVVARRLGPVPGRLVPESKAR
jgi:hypothetical protein